MKQWLVGLLLIACSGVAVPATREYEIKAAFVFNFVRFIQWPTPGAGYTVGILGEDPFEGGLRDFESKPIGGKKVSVRKVTSAKDARSCDVVFVSASEGDQVKGVLTELRGAPVLTVSDIPSFADKGGSIGLTTESNRVRFVVNTDSLRKGDLKASAKLLQLATRTISQTGTEGVVADFEPLPATGMVDF